MSLTHVMKNQTKIKCCWKSSISWRKIKISVHAFINDGFWLWLDTMNSYLSKGSKVHNYNARQRYKDMRMKNIIHCWCAKLNSIGEDKWRKNQPRWLVRGTKQVLVNRQFTICELLTTYVKVKVFQNSSGWSVIYI